MEQLVYPMEVSHTVIKLGQISKKAEPLVTSLFSNSKTEERLFGNLRAVSFQQTVSTYKTESLYSVFELGSKTHLLPRGRRKDVPLSSAVAVIRQLFPTFCVIPLCWRNSTWAVSMEKGRFSCCSWAYLFTPMASFIWVPSVFFSSQCSLCQLHCGGKGCGTSQPVPSGLKQIYCRNNNSQFQHYMLQRRNPFVCTLQ